MIIVTDAGLGRHVRKLRAQKGISREGLSSRMGHSKEWLIQREAGAICLTAEDLYDIAKSLKESLDDMGELLVLILFLIPCAT